MADFSTSRDGLEIAVLSSALIEFCVSLTIDVNFSDSLFTLRVSTALSEARVLLDRLKLEQTIVEILHCYVCAYWLFSSGFQAKEELYVTLLALTGRD